MSRQLRIEYENAFYHVLSRGNNKKDVFKTDIDNNKFLKIISEAHDKYKILVHAYVLMKNHYHIIIETPQANLSSAMQYINSKYTSWFNNSNNEVGHLFQGRYKAILVDKDEYLLPLSRYIHLNPVRANYVKNPQKYQWSSFKKILNDSESYKWLMKSFILNAMGGAEKYKNYVMEFKQKEIENPFSKIKGQSFLCAAEFLEKIKKEVKGLEEITSKEVRDKEFLKKKITCDEIINRMIDKFKISKEEIVTKGKHDNKYRKLAVYLCKKYSDNSNIEIGNFFGEVTGSCISYYYRWGNRVNRELEDEIMGSGLKN